MGLKNITFSADERTIEQARIKARQHHTTLNVAFRQWLDRYAEAYPTPEEFGRIMQRLSYVDSGGKFTREQMNERKPQR